MRTTVAISVTLPSDMLKRVRKLAARKNRTMSELVREALRQYDQSLQALGKREQTLMEFHRAVEAFRVIACGDRLDKLTMRDLNKEIRAARDERRKRLGVAPSIK